MLNESGRNDADREADDEREAGAADAVLPSSTYELHVRVHGTTGPHTRRAAGAY
jgi:hypothetical protein